MRRSLLLVALALGACGGCTHVQLRKNTVRQALTVADIHQQQVLNNLAMFVYDPNSLPTFSYPNQSASNVTDTGSIDGSGDITRAPLGFLWLSSLGSMFSASRQAQEAFTLNPVNDPRKLELMRCAYQKALGGCFGTQMSEHCPDCQTIQKKFYTGDPDGDIDAKANGIVTSNCIDSKRCWFHYSCKKCLPKYTSCLPVGHHCGVYVWVEPNGRDQLTRLTLTILDYALNSPPVPITKTVTYYIDEYGIPTTQAASVGVVSASVQYDETPASLMNMSPAEEVRLEQVLKARLLQVSLALRDVEQRLNLKRARAGSAADDKDSAAARGNPTLGDARPGQAVTDPDSARFASLLAEQDSLHAKLRYLAEQLRVQTLKHPYVAAGPPPAVPSSILPFQLQQRALTPVLTFP
ncbi:MAG TPA: hypothetical protein VFI31_15625 [Pirellulales bacterium]|nr:hypothetical protein [Pirellulales bacterium]